MPQDVLYPVHPLAFPWTPELDAKLKELWPIYSINSIAHELNCMHGTIERRARKLGLGPRRQVNPNWSKERETKLIEMWEDGYSATIIGQVLGYSRNAILGKRMRMKLPPRGIGFRKHNGKSIPPKRRNQHTKHKANGVKTAIPMPTTHDMTAADAINPGITIMELKGNRCRSVLRTLPTGARYCGKDTYSDNRSFCPGHHAIYYVPPRQRA